MQRWLFKSEPSDYGLADLKRDKQTLWTGIKNPLARIHLRSIEAGDPILLYHSGKEKSIVGEMKANRVAVRAKGAKEQEDVFVEVSFVKEFATPVPLSEIRQDPLFAGWELVRMSRLSVMPVTEKLWKRLEQLAGG